MPITLSPLTLQNWEDCAELKVGPTQEGMVAPNVWSIAESSVRPESTVRVIYDNQVMVGFLMYLRDETLNEVELYRFMIDFSKQQHGFGLLAVDEFVKQIKSLTQPPRRIVVKFLVENLRAQRLYEKAGFTDTGEIAFNEQWRFTEKVYDMRIAE